MISRILKPACLLLLLSLGAKAQLYTGAHAFFIKGKSTLSADGVVLVPDKDLSISNTVTESGPEIIKWPVFKSLNKVYHFSRPLLFTGTIGINVDPATLNGNSLSQLQLAFSSKPVVNYADYSITNRTVVNGSFVNYFASDISFSRLTATARVADEQLVHAENFFTPNGDGINDKWVIQDIQLYPGNKLKIIDRAGKVLYTKTDYDNSWDGTFSGAPLAQGTYYYILELSKDIAPIKGFISIIRNK